jgi:hypothetical protein
MTPAQAPWIRRCPDADGDCTNEQTAAELNRATARAIIADMQTASDLYALAEAGLRIDMQNVFYHRDPDAIKVNPAPAKRLNYTTWCVVILLVVLWAMAAIWILAGGTPHA